MLFRSLVKLHALLHSYMCFSLLEKLFLSNLDTSSTLPWYLVTYRALKLFLIAILTDPRQLGGSIGKVPGPSIASQQLVDQSSFCYCVFAFFLNTFLTATSIDAVFLNTFLERWLDTSICRELLRIYIFVLRNPNFIFSRYLCLFTFQITLFHSKPLFKWFSSFFKVFVHLVSS